MMGNQDKQRMFVFMSALIEVTLPLLQDNLKKGYKNLKFNTFFDFLNSQTVKHTLFHLKYTMTSCCIDTHNCITVTRTPLNTSQWTDLYSKNASTCQMCCHCKFIAKHIEVDDLDLTLIFCILSNCIINPKSQPNILDAINELRKLKNDYFSHNKKMTLSQEEFKEVWKCLDVHLKLFPNHKLYISELNQIKNRPLDETLHSKYSSMLIDITGQLHETEDYVSAYLINIGISYEFMDGVIAESICNRLSFFLLLKLLYKM